MAGRTLVGIRPWLTSATIGCSATCQSSDALPPLALAHRFILFPCFFLDTGKMVYAVVRAEGVLDTPFSGVSGLCRRRRVGRSVAAGAILPHTAHGHRLRNTLPRQAQYPPQLFR